MKISSGKFCSLLLVILLVFTALSLTGCPDPTGNSGNDSLISYAALDTAITNAGIAKAGVETSHNGEDIYEVFEWVTSSVMDAFNDAIMVAQTFRTQGTTQTEIDDAVNVLNDATNNFNATKNYGKLTVDQAALQGAIEYASFMLTITVVSTPEGNNVLPHWFWITQAEWNAVVAAIAIAEDVLLNGGDITSAFISLASFESVIKSAFFVYFVDDNILDQVVNQGGRATKPAPDPTMVGHQFLYWETGYGIEWDFNNTVYNDIFLFPKWVPYQYTVSFNLDGGSGTGDYSTQTISPGSKVTMPTPNPEKAGHYFVHWVNAANDVEWDFDTVVAADITLRAIWHQYAIENWTLRSVPEPSLIENNTWNSVTYGNGLFVAVSSNGTNRVATSPDGVDWTPRQAVQNNSWRSVTYGNGLFVAVAADGTNRVMTSEDGITWTARSAPIGAWRAVTYGEVGGSGLFLAVGQNVEMTSPDGITWTAQTIPEAYWNSVTFGEVNGSGLFVATNTVGDIWTSPDGITWTRRSASYRATEKFVTYGIVQGQGMFVCVASTYAGSNVSPVLISSNGITWTGTNGPVPVGEWRAVTYGEVGGSGLFVAVASSQIMTSPDGANWTVRSIAGFERSVTYGNGMFVAVGNGAWASPDGISWSYGKSNLTSVTYGMVQGSGLFVAVANEGRDRVMTSPDGITWTARSAPIGTWSAVTYGEVGGSGLFVAVARSGTNRIMTSPDGITWTAQSSPNMGWESVTYGNGIFVVINTSYIVTSHDGTNWWTMQVAPGNDDWWTAVTYAEDKGLFIAVARNGDNRVMTSPDGVTWTTQAGITSPNSNWQSISYGIVQNTGLFVAVNTWGGNRVMTSPDGITWTARQAAEAKGWQSVTYGMNGGVGLFVAVAGGVYDGINRVMISFDGINWAVQQAATDNQWASVTYGSVQNTGLFVAVGENGAIMTAEWSPAP